MTEPEEEIKKEIEEKSLEYPKCKSCVFYLGITERNKEVSDAIDETKEMVGHMALVISALQHFKYKCYEQAGKGVIDTDWLMNNAPCNIDSIEILCRVLEKYYPEIYAYKGKSIKQMEEELKSRLGLGR